MNLKLGNYTLDLAHPKVMGVVNRTPDSFSDGGAYTNLDVALRHALRMVSEGAAIIDVGGESTRPGSTTISAQQELDRVMPFIERLVREAPVPVSVDTSKPEVMREAIHAGAVMINDVYALRQSGAVTAALACAVPVCLMHMQGEPRTMQQDPHYSDVVAEVKQFLKERSRACESSGIAHDQIIIDPGFGFGKSLNHNLELLAKLDEFTSLGFPILVGLSRKTMISQLLGNVDINERVYGSAAAAVIAVQRGASIVRVHDVRATVDALKVIAAVNET